MPDARGHSGTDYGADINSTAFRVQIPPPLSVREYPWETWTLGSNLEGDPLKNMFVIQGDEHIRRGERQEALEAFRRAQGEILEPVEAHALAIRLASSALVLDDARAALASLSEYYRRQGGSINTSIDTVDARSALIFAYSYGRLGQVDQAFAWFSRTNLLTRASGPLSDSAAQGARLLLRRLPDAEFERAENRWRGDAFVQSMIAQERLRRSREKPSHLPRTGAEIGRFWEVGHQATSEVPQHAEFGSAQIGVILPLSGQFAAMGESLRRGVELAALGQGFPSESLLIRDDAGVTAQASGAAQELIASYQPRVILGTISSEPAETIATLARSKGVPVLSFSKRSYFPIGGGVFRLGPTFESQAISLVRGAKSRLGIQKFAILYPTSSVETEFATAFERALEQEGLQAIFKESYQTGNGSQMALLAQKLEASGAEAVFFPDSLQAASQFLSSLTSAGRQRIRVLGSARFDNPNELSRSPAALSGIIFVSAFFPESEKPAVNQFVQSFEAKFERKPDFLAAQGFDAATLAIVALRHSLQSQLGFQDSFARLGNYAGLTGSIRVREDGEIEREMPLLIFENGKRSELERVATPVLRSPEDVIQQ